MTLDQINSLIGSLDLGDTSAPHEMKQDVAIHDPRSATPGVRRSTMKLEDIMAMSPDEQTTALKALGIENRRLKAETGKLRRFNEVRSGQADRGIRAQRYKPKLNRGIPRITQQGKPRPYMIERLGNASAAPMKGKGERLADVVGSEIDTPTQEAYTNPSYGRDPRHIEYKGKMAAALDHQHSRVARKDLNVQQFGETQNPPQYRGIRFLLPGTGGDYSFLDDPKGNRVPGYDGINQEFLGHMITRGYPIYGGTGQMEGFEPGFNPIGFGQRETGAKALLPPR